MNCAESQLWLAEYSLSILDPARAAAMEDHLSGCAACASRAAEALRAAGELRAALEHDLPITAPRADVTALLQMARNDGSATRPGAPVGSSPWRALFLRWAPLAAAVFLAGVGVGALSSAAAQNEKLGRRLETLEEVAPLIVERSRDEARAAVIPVSQQWARTLDARDERLLRELEELVVFIRRARAADAAAIADTRAGLQLTRDALLRFAEQVPTIRPVEDR